MCRQRHVVMAVVSACSMLLCIAVNRKEDFTPDVKSVDTKDDRARTASWQVGLYWIASGMLAEIVKLASSRINQHPYFLDSASITAAPFYLLRMLYQYAQRRKHLLTKGIWVGRTALDERIPAGASLFAGKDVFHWIIMFDGAGYELVDGADGMFVHEFSVFDQYAAKFEFHRIPLGTMKRTRDEIREFVRTYPETLPDGKKKFHIINNNCQDFVMAAYGFACDLTPFRAKAYMRASMPTFLL